MRKLLQNLAALKCQLYTAISVSKCSESIEKCGMYFLRFLLDHWLSNMLTNSGLVSHLVKNATCSVQSCTFHNRS